MPIIESTYICPKLLQNSHLHTILCATLRKKPRLPYRRERIELTDGDFLDLDWSTVNSKKLVIITHGMEGSSQSRYVLHTVKRANALGYSALAWNMRGCSGESNRKIHFYHSGKTEDLAHVIKHAKKSGYQQIYLVGFSLGGNLMLLYLGQQGKNLPKQIKGAAAVSAPVDLVTSQQQIELPENRIYLARFLKEFRRKFRQKRNERKVYIDVKKFRSEIKTLAHLDAHYTAPWNGFANERVYYEQCSSLPLLSKIAIPTLLLNPRDDSFLSPECYPDEIAKKSKMLFLEMPSHGGHCALLLNHRFNESYIEQRIFNFFAE